MMPFAVHLMANAVHPSEAPEEHPSAVPDVRWWPLQYTWWQVQYTQVKLLMFMMACSVHLLAYTVHHVRLLIYMIGYADYLMANAVDPSEAPEVHPSVVSDVRRWPLHYTCWQMQYTQVRLLKCTPVFLMLDDGKCSTPKWSFWCTWWHIQYTCWHIQYTMWGSWFTW